MSFWQNIKAIFSGDEQKMDSLDLWREVYGGREASSGVRVNIETALQVTTVQAVCRVLAEGVAQIPFRLYQDQGDNKKILTDHPVNKIISQKPNGWQSSFEFRETLMYHTVLTGNAYIFVNRVGIEREIRELVLIEPNRVEVTQKENGSLVYKVRSDTGKVAEFGQDAIWHVRGPSWNSWLGLDAVKIARDAIGLSISMERNHSDMHKNGTQVSGMYTVQDKLGKEQFEFLSEWLETYSIGQKRHGKPMVLDRGASFTPLSMTGVDAQHLESRKHQIEEICRVFRVMPIMIGHADKTATYASAEQMFLAHVVHTLSPWYQRIEQSADLSLLTEEDRASGLYTKFNPNALMRGAAKDRADFYTKALGAGGHGTAWMTRNEVRALEEMDRLDDPAADALPTPEASQVSATAEEEDDGQV